MYGFGQSRASLMPVHFMRFREPCSVSCAHIEAAIEQNATVTIAVCMFDLS